MLKLAIAVVVFSHGIGHVLFLAPTTKLAQWADQSGHSWLLTGTVGDTLSRGVAALVWSATIVLFVAGVYGFMTGQEWWRPITVVAALVSLAGIAVFWDGIAVSNAIFALVFDAIVLVALLWVHWPTTELA